MESGHLWHVLPAVRQCSLLVWLQIGKTKPDALAVHYYGTASSDFVSYVTMMQQRYKLDVWVTEVASTATTLASVTAVLVSDAHAACRLGKQ